MLAEVPAGVWDWDKTISWGGRLRAVGFTGDVGVGRGEERCSCFSVEMLGRIMRLGYWGNKVRGGLLGRVCLLDLRAGI